MSVWILFFSFQSKDLHFQETRSRGSHPDLNQIWFCRLLFVTVVHLAKKLYFFSRGRHCPPLKKSTKSLLAESFTYFSINLFDKSIF